MKREKLNEHQAYGTIVSISRSCEFIPSGYLSISSREGSLVSEGILTMTRDKFGQIT